MTWIAEHWDDVVTILTGLCALALVIVKLTPSKRDDKIAADIVGGIAGLLRVKLPVGALPEETPPACPACGHTPPVAEVVDEDDTVDLTPTDRPSKEA